MTTKEERRSMRIAKKFVDILIDLEMFEGDAEVIMNDCEVYASGELWPLSTNQKAELRAIVEVVKRFLNCP